MVAAGPAIRPNGVPDDRGMKRAPSRDPISAIPNRKPINLTMPARRHSRRGHGFDFERPIGQDNPKIRTNILQGQPHGETRWT